MNKLLKRTIAGGLSIVMAASIICTNSLTNVTEVQAKQKVFAKITEKYKADATFTILEIVPEAEDYSFPVPPNDGQHENGRSNGQTISVKANAEMGYFIAKQPQTSPYCEDQRAVESATGVSRAGRYGSPILPASTSQEYQNALYDMYTYGLIKPDGTDSGGIYDHLGAYPIFARYMIFSLYPSQTATNAFDKLLERGVYSKNEGGTGKYVIADGYDLDENGTICKVTISMNEIPAPEPDPSVSDNTVSGNEAPQPTYEEVRILEPVTDINRTKIQLPMSAEGFEYIKLANPENSGNVDFTRVEDSTTKTQYYGFSERTLYYSVDSDSKMKYTNSDWFREYVLGDNEEYNLTKIDYITKNAKDVTVADVEKADLVYVSGSDELFAPNTNDISNDVLIELFNRVVIKHQAVMMDYKLYNENLRTNISKLALLLWQNEQSGSFTKAMEDNADQEWFNKDSKSLVSTVGLFNDASMVSFLKQGLKELVNGTKELPAKTNGNFVRGNLYVYNHHRSDYVSDRNGQLLAKSQVDAEDNFANGDFATAYNADITISGFSEVLNYITVSNTNSMTGMMNTAVTPAVAIQYILIADGQPISLMKNTLRVLEIEPGPSYLFNYTRGSLDYVDLDEIPQMHHDERRKDTRNTGNYISEGETIRDFIRNNRKNFVKNYLSSYYSDGIDDPESTMLKYITFTSMSVMEFNGRNEDLVESYDIIYIGANNHINMLLNMQGKTFLKTKGDKLDGYTIFKDSSMDGNVYFNMGDLTDAYVGRSNGRSYLSGYIDNERCGPGSYDNSTILQRFPGRDISRNKLAKMEEFLEAKGLVIVDGSIYGYQPGATSFEKSALKINPTATAAGNGSGDHGRLDNSSNMYELIQYARGYRYNYSFDGTGARSYVAYNNSAGNQVVYDNLVSAAYLEHNQSAKEDYNQYVSSDRLSLILTDMPTPYTYEYEADGKVIDTNTIKYMEYTEDGVRCMKYEFSIGKELNSVVNATDTYIATLYFDLNNDGKFSKTTEKVDDVTIALNSTDGVQPVKNANGEYILNLNTNYVLKRKLSEDFSGIIKWKLEIKSTTDTFNHATQEGYSLVKNITGFDKQVKILQLNSSNSTLNLENVSKNANNDWSRFIKNAPGYKVTIKTVTIGDFEVDLNNKYQAFKNDPNTPDYSIQDYATKVYFEEYPLVPGNGANAEPLVKGVNMLVLGFGDDIEPFGGDNRISAANKDNGIDAIYAFIAKGKPVLMTHDILSCHAEYRQDTKLRYLIGMDKYSVTQNIKATTLENGTTSYSLVNKLLYPVTSGDSSITGEPHAANLYSSASDGTQMARLESFSDSLGKQMAYLPGSERKTIVKEKSGYSNFYTDWDNVKGQYFCNRAHAQVQSDRDGNNMNAFTEYTIEKLNGGQITEFPYRLPDSFKTSTTHSQYFELDMSVDADRDGESDVVVWYALGESVHFTGQLGGNMYSDTQGESLDPANGYYIYNDGNVTYTGAGHSSLTDAPTAEKQLFVNTLLAAFEVGTQAPSAGFYESTETGARKTECIAVPYDENVTINAATGNPVNTNDSSVLKKGDDYLYQFVDPNTATGANKEAAKAVGTKIYFKVSDANLVRGTKNIYAKYYVKVENTMRVTTTGTQRTVRLYGVDLPVTTISYDKEEVDVVDISEYIDTYDVVQSTGVFAETPRTKITDVNVNYPEGSLTASKDNRLPWKNGVKGLQSGVYYGLYLPMSYLGNNASFTLYMENMTATTSITTAGEEVAAPDTKSNFQKLCVTKADLLYLD